MSYEDNPLFEVMRLAAEVASVRAAMGELGESLVSIFGESRDELFAERVREYNAGRKELRERESELLTELRAAVAELLHQAADPIDLNTRRFLNKFRQECERADGLMSHYTFDEAMFPRDSFDLALLFDAHLTEKQREALTLRWGLFGAERLCNISAVARSLEISRSAADDRIRAAWRTLVSSMRLSTNPA